jgi:outer membrane immunogenic protein
MKRIVGALMFSLVAAGSALAADLPAAPPPQAPAMYVPVVAPVYNWAGIYVGVNGGWGFGNAKWIIPSQSTTGGTVAAVGGTSGSVSDNGGVFGGTLGANWQAGALVLGLEGDFDYSGINTGTSGSICSSFGACQTKNNWLATARGRVGYAADRVLFYGTGGGAFGGTQTVVDGTSTSKTKAGWTAGLGVEAAFADNWTAKVEYLYVNLGSVTGTGACGSLVCTDGIAPDPVTLPVSGTVSLTESLVRVGVNYKFNF